MKMRIVAITLASLLASVTSGVAEDYPTRPITMIVPFAAGGPTDVVARLLAEGMRASLGQNVLIENFTGAAGSLGVGRAVRAAPDGYTLSIGHWSTHVINGAIYNLPYNLLTDLAPVALMFSNPQLIVANLKVPAEIAGRLDQGKPRQSVGRNGRPGQRVACRRPLLSTLQATPSLYSCRIAAPGLRCRISSAGRSS